MYSIIYDYGFLGLLLLSPFPEFGHSAAKQVEGCGFSFIQYFIVKISFVFGICHKMYFLWGTHLRFKCWGFSPLSYIFVFLGCPHFKVKEQTFLCYTHNVNLDWHQKTLFFFSCPFLLPLPPFCTVWRCNNLKCLFVLFEPHSERSYASSQSISRAAISWLRGSLLPIHCVG